MAYKIFPLNDSPIPDSATWSALMSRFANDGIVSGYGGELAVTAGTGLSVDVDTGAAIIQGVYFENTSAANLALSPADTVDPRIDLVVVRIDYIGGSAQSGLYVLTGTPAASPSAPTPSQIAGQIWEIPLAEIYVAAGATSVSASDITDRRVWVAPAPHADSHATGGSDQITPAMIGAAPAQHASQHAAGGSDPVTIDLSQIAQSGAADGQMPAWNSAAGVWTPVDPVQNAELLVDDTLTSDTAVWNISIPNAADYPILRILLEVRSTRTNTANDEVSVAPNGASSGYYSGTMQPTAGGTYGNVYTDLWRWGSIATDYIADTTRKGVVRVAIYHTGEASPVYHGTSLLNADSPGVAFFGGTYPGAGAGAAITSLVLTLSIGNFKAGSRIRIWGVKEVALW